MGVTNIERVIRIGGQLYLATIDCFVEPGAGTPFDVVIDDAAGLKVENLARRIAVELRERQDAALAEVRIAARYPEHKPAPESGIPTQEIYTLLGAAVATERGARRRVGVTAQGMIASSRAQRRVAEHSRERLAAGGFSDAEIDGIFEALPVATHDQRGLGTLELELPEDCDADLDALELLAIVEDSMSSEIYELMKRSDEGAIVEKATRNARPAEECVAECIRGVVERFAELPGDVLVTARQESFETVQLHTVVAERAGSLGQLRLSAA